MSIRFLDTFEAIKWAEELANRPPVGSQIGKLLAKPKPSWVEPKTDIALTISAQISMCHPIIAGMATRSVYGVLSTERDAFVARHLSYRLSATDPGKGKDLEKLYRLAVVTLKAERAKRLYGDRYPVMRMAHDVGVSRKTFTRNHGWIDLRATATSQLCGWLQRVEYELGAWLESMGYI